MAMKTTFAAALLSASMLAAPAFAQITTVPMPAAPAPSATGPALATGIPATPLTSGDTKFVSRQLEGNMAEIKLAQLALKQSQDQNVRNFAQKMITDHTQAYQTLLPMAQRQNIPEPTALTPRQQGMYDRLSKMDGVRFDVTYINDMIRMHEMTVTALNDELTHGQSQWINVWVQNTRPVVQQHLALAQQLKTELPRTG
jgi:putative membrane protein